MVFLIDLLTYPYQKGFQKKKKIGHHGRSLRAERLQTLIFFRYDEYVTIFSTGSLQGGLGPGGDIEDRHWYYPKYDKYNNDFIHWTQHFHKGQLISKGLFGVFISSKNGRNRTP